MNSEHYFDWAATSPADDKILKEALELSIEHFGNPSSSHKAGMDARKILEEARERSAKVLGVKANQLYFTSGGTESDHIPLLSLLNSPHGKDKSGRIIISGIEHPALREEAAMLKKLGFDVVTVNPDKNGFVNVESIMEALNSETIFVTIMAVNNETGCIQPIYEIADELIKYAGSKRKAFFHVDCVQAAGKIPLDLSHPGIDSAALSAHKISGPRGIGLLYLSKEIKSFLLGGGQEANIRSGTENLFGAIAFSKCLEKYYLGKNAGSQAMERYELQKKWTLDFLKKIKASPKCSLVPSLREDFTLENQEKFSPWVIQAAFPGIPGNVMVRALDAKGFYISTGSACSAKKQSRPILQAMNVSRQIQDSAVRFSFGHSTSKKAMDELAQAILEVVSLF